MKDVNIVNIIVIVYGNLSTIESFIISIGENSQKEINSAEKLFTDKIKVLDSTLNEDDLENCLDEGYFSSGNGTEIYLSWSTNSK